MWLGRFVGLALSTLCFSAVIVGGVAVAFCQTSEPVPYRSPITGLRFMLKGSNEQQEAQIEIVRTQGMIVSMRGPAEEWSMYGHFKSYNRYADGRDKNMERLWPLAVGGSIEFQQNYAASSEDKALNHHRITVESREDLTTSAGNFRVFKVRVNSRHPYNTTSTSIFWWDPVTALMVKWQHGDTTWTVTRILK